MLYIEPLHARSNCATKLDFGQLNQFIAVAESHEEALEITTLLSINCKPIAVGICLYIMWVS